MLSRIIYSELGRVVRLLGLIQARVAEGAETAELKLLIESANDTLGRLMSNLGVEEAEAVERFKRHLSFLAYYHERDEPESYRADLRDLTQTDLPGIIELVREWEDSLLAPGLIEAVSGSWEANQPESVVRDAFIYLEEALRSAGQIPRSEGMTPDRLVSTLLAPGSDRQLKLSDAEPLSPETRGEQQGVMHLFKGAFLLFRNASAHRFIRYDPQQADELLRLVNLCLRILGTERQAPFEIRLDASEATQANIASIRAILERYPGPVAVYLVLKSGEHSRTIRIDERYRVDVSDQLRAELKSLLGRGSI